MTKFRKGTLVEVMKGWPRKGLVGLRFYVTETKVAESDSFKGLGVGIRYETPYDLGLLKGNLWVLEDFLREVHPDEGFVYDDTIEVFIPVKHVTKDAYERIL